MPISNAELEDQVIEFADEDQVETSEWLNALQSVVQVAGKKRAHFLMRQLYGYLNRHGLGLPTMVNNNTPYVNTIPLACQPDMPGDRDIECRIRSYTRWNALAMVLRAAKKTNVGGHIASFASSATLYDVGFNHFWRAPSKENGGDFVFFQGHASPGIYSRAYLLGRLNEGQLDNFRQEVNGNGISSYPHPWLMPDFWQFTTVSMGLGPIMAIYQARFMRYLSSRGLVQTSSQKVWAFLGDGETDEPETLGAISLAGREKLDNLIFVVNCNLQRLDGPVRGNGQIIQELERIFLGAGWNVIKVCWGGRWDDLFASDAKNLLIKRMEQVVDGEYQTYKSKNGAFVREHFFNSEELKKLVEDWSDDDIWRLNRGGHDPKKIYAAYLQAQNAQGKPTVILAKTIKGYGMGEAGESMNIAHQQKKLPIEVIKKFRDKFDLPISDAQIEDVPYIKFEENSEEMQYLKQVTNRQGGFLPQRSRVPKNKLLAPKLTSFDAILRGSRTNEHEFSTTMVFVRLLNILMRDKKIGHHVVPIVPDESRTFGMEGMFRQYGIWNQFGQAYDPEDQDQLMFYKESQTGQILQEGINEAGGMCDWIAAATSYSTHREQLLPFYIFYSMFGFQRIGDLAWAAADMRSRGFLLGGTSGRTTLNGEGLQHEDGHSHLFSATIPTCLSYDPTFAYELAVIIHDGLKRMLDEQKDVFYYITLMNENYIHPAMPTGVEEDIIKGMYCFKKNDSKDVRQVYLLGSGSIFNEVIAAAEILEKDWEVTSTLWSVTSFTELARDGYAVTRWNILNSLSEPRISHVEKLLAGYDGPVIAATDYVRAYADQIREFVPCQYLVLGTDGFGRSDTREQLRRFFEVDRYWIAIAALKALADKHVISVNIVDQALDKYNIDRNKPNPWNV